MKHLLYFFTFILLFGCKDKTQQQVSGAIFGTTYSIIYQSNEDYSSAFDSIFEEINNSMSTYIPKSIISQLNQTDSFDIDSHFNTVFLASKAIFEDTEGAFDPTIGAVVNAWDFGPNGSIDQLDSLKITVLMKSVGLDKVHLSQTKISKPKATQLDFNAIAKGYGVDAIGELLESKHIQNYLIEIGGEIRCRGINSRKNAPWTVGVQNPNLDSEQQFVDTVVLNNESMATSGTYRKFKIDEQGRRYTHIIDTKTGFPSRTNILSVSVITKDCMNADAYATALQTMPLNRLDEFLQQRPQLKVFIVYEDDNKALAFKTFNGF